MTITNPDKQVLLLCDEDGRSTGHAPRGACHAGDGLLHRAVFVVLANADGHVLLQRRRSGLWDGIFDFAGATHPLHADGRDETDREAAERCVRVEWGADVALVERFAFTYFERDGDRAEREYCVVFTGVTDAVLEPNPDYAYGAEWEAWATLVRRMDDDPAQFTPWAHAARPTLARHPEWLHE